MQLRQIVDGPWGGRGEMLPRSLMMAGAFFVVSRLTTCSGDRLDDDPRRRFVGSYCRRVRQVGFLGVLEAFFASADAAAYALEGPTGDPHSAPPLMILCHNDKPQLLGTT